MAIRSINALEALFLSYGYLDGHDALVDEALLQILDGPSEIGPLPVHLVDEEADGYGELVRVLPHLFRLHPDARHGAHDDDGAVDDPHAELGVIDEVVIARGVDEVDLVLVPVEAGKGGGYGGLPLYLLRLVVHERRPLVHPAQSRILAGEKERGLDDGGLALASVGKHA